MFLGRVAFVLGFFLLASVNALAQNIPSSALPGREREIFTAPPARLSRSANPLLQRFCCIGDPKAMKLSARHRGGRHV
jgi:hypothetical protein